MAASQLIATGTGPADSSEITIVAGDTVAVAIKGGSGMQWSAFTFRMTKVALTAFSI